MAKNTLPTNYVDDIMNVSANGNRKYRMIYNDDGTVSFEDVTPYEQVGSDYSAIDINTTNEAVNESFDKNKIVPDLTTIKALTEQGYVPDALAVKQLNESLGIVDYNMVYQYAKTFAAKSSLNINIGATDQLIIFIFGGTNLGNHIFLARRTSTPTVYCEHMAGNEGEMTVETNSPLSKITITNNTNGAFILRVMSFTNTISITA